MGANWNGTPLTDAESKILSNMSELENVWDKKSILIALKWFDNAEKVLKVLEINGGLKSKQGSYRLYCIIANIGERSPEQYVEDVNRAVREFNEQYFKDHPEIAHLYRFVRLNAAHKLIMYRAFERIFAAIFNDSKA